MSVISGEGLTKLLSSQVYEARTSKAKNILSRSAQYKLNQVLVMEPFGI
jgi:hypothetical protein